MARSLYSVKEEYVGNGLLSAYTFDFKIESLNHLTVIEVDDSGVETERVLGGDTTYLSSVDFDPVAGGGTVNLAAVLTDGYRLILLLANDEPTQPSEFKDKFDFTLKRVEAALDFIVGGLQRVSYLARRSMKLSDLDDPEDFDPTLPPGMEGAASLIPTTNTDGDGWADVDEWTPLVDLTNAVDAAAAAADSEDAAGTSEINAAASALAAAGSATAAAASALAAAASATQSDLAASDADDSKTAAQLAATNAATSASAASTSALAAAGSATNASTSASNAATSATNASVSATASSASASAAAASAAAAAASAASVAAPSITGTFAVPYACVAGTTIPFVGTAYQNKWYIKGTGGVDMSASPQIAAATNEGQELVLVGTSDTDTVLLETGTGLNIQNAWLAEANRILTLSWDAGQAVWVEKSRS